MASASSVSSRLCDDLHLRATEGGKIYCNREVEAVLGYTPEQIHLSGRTCWGTRTPRGPTPPLGRGLARQGGPRARVRWHRTPPGLAAQPPLPTRRTGDAVIVPLDITPQGGREADQAHCLHDALTGLPNRALFHDRLAQALARGAADGRARGRGDGARSRWLQRRQRHARARRRRSAAARVAARLGALIRASDTLARLGGDEFAVVQRDAPARRCRYAGGQAPGRACRPLRARWPGRSMSPPASASPCSRATGPMVRRCSSTPTSRSTAPRRRAGTGSPSSNRRWTRRRGASTAGA